MCVSCHGLGAVSMSGFSFGSERGWASLNAFHGLRDTRQQSCWARDITVMICSDSDVGYESPTKREEPVCLGRESGCRPVYNTVTW